MSAGKPETELIILFYCSSYTQTSKEELNLEGL